MAHTKRFWLPLACLIGAALGISGCKPSDLPATGGLVATDRPVETAADPPLRAAAHETTVAPQVEPALPPAAENPPPIPSTPIVASPGLIPVDVASGGSAQGGTQQPAGNPSSPPVAPRGVPPIRLSAGIAVPQSLPMGTVMGMSVDYQVFGALNGSSRYVWVVSSEGGGNVEVAMPPQSEGTLQAFFLKLRPEHRPFNCHIDEIAPGGKRTRVSNVAAMQTNY
jgi:hypothetical protein